MTELRLLPLKEVRLKVGLSGATIYRKMAEGSFPKPCKQGSRSLWVSSELNAWIASAIEERDHAEDSTHKDP
jgi:predicted DNA-binding transcriptional regulator AlpA